MGQIQEQKKQINKIDYVYEDAGLQIIELEKLKDKELYLDDFLKEHINFKKRVFQVRDIYNNIQLGFIVCKKRQKNYTFISDRRIGLFYEKLEVLMESIGEINP